MCMWILASFWIPQVVGSSVAQQGPCLRLWALPPDCCPLSVVSALWCGTPWRAWGRLQYHLASFLEDCLLAALAWKMTCFQINHRPPCGFRAPHKPSERLCRAGGEACLPPDWKVCYENTCVPGYALCTQSRAPPCPPKRRGPQQTPAGPLFFSPDDVWLFCLLWFRAFIIRGKKIKHFTEWNTADVLECGFYDYKFNQPF